MPASKPFAHEIASLSHLELEIYLENSGRVVSVQDPENVSLDLIQRLREMVRCHRGAVDLEEVSARLEQIVPTDREAEAVSLSPAATESPPGQDELIREELQKEEQCYHALVDAGGRPPYPLHLLEEVFWYPNRYLEHQEYGDVLKFWRWRVDSAERLCICGGQLSRWERFRRLQNIIRERSLKSERILLEAAEWGSWEEYTQHPASNNSAGQWGFPQYAERVRKRLAQYGIKRQFHLHPNAYWQDKLTTWLEYLSHEYYFYDTATTYVKRFQRRHDEAWRKLIASDFWTAGETYDDLCNLDMAPRYAQEEDKAEKVVKLEMVGMSPCNETNNSLQCDENLSLKRYTEAEVAVNAVQAPDSKMKAWNNAVVEFHRTTERFRREKDEVQRYSCLLRWIVRQVPLIELELNTTDRLAGFQGLTSSRGQKRRREDEHEEDPSLQKRCRSRKAGLTAIDRTRWNPTEAQHLTVGLPMQHTGCGLADTSAPALQPRRSARILDKTLSKTPLQPKRSCVDARGILQPHRRKQKVSAKR